MPAEWEPHEATWLGWPQNATDWPGKMNAIQWVYGEMVRKIAPGEKVRILVDSPAGRSPGAPRAGARPGRILRQVEFFRWPTDRGWMRDSGPIFVRRNVRGRRERAIVHFHFNAWARYDNWRQDRKVPERASRATGPAAVRRPVPRPPVRAGGRRHRRQRARHAADHRGVLPGPADPGPQSGAEPRGLRDSAAPTTWACSNVLWLGHGIAGDDTHGHVDDLCRFVNPTTVVLIQSRDPHDVNYRPLAENLRAAPGPAAGRRVEDRGRAAADARPRCTGATCGCRPATPTSTSPTRRCWCRRSTIRPTARRWGSSAELFPDRPVVGIHAVDLVLGFGTLHCLTQQQPA